MRVVRAVSAPSALIETIALIGETLNPPAGLKSEQGLSRGIPPSNTEICNRAFEITCQDRPKLDRLARSVPDARSIADELAAYAVTLALGQSRYDPSDPMGKMFFNILATFAEFEANLIRLRTREGTAIVRAKGKLKGKRPKLSDKQQKELLLMHRTEKYLIGDLGELFSISRPTVYRTPARTVSE